MIPAVCIPMMYSLAGKGLSEHAEKRQWAGALTRRFKRIHGGDIACPGVELNELATTCPAPLYRDSWNYWKLVRSSYDGVKVQDLPDRTLAFMSRVNGRVDGKIRLAKSDVSLSPMRPEDTVTHRRQDCETVPMSLKASEFQPAFYTVYVRFIYRGSMTHMAWPAILHSDWKDAASVAVGNDGCPVNASWLLDTIYAPSQDNVPDASQDSILPPHLADNAPTLPAWALPVGLLIGGVVLAVGAGYAIRSIR